MKNSRWKQSLKNYITNNYKEYILVGLLFIIGLFAGVLIINNIKEEQISEVSSYINEFITRFKTTENIDRNAMIIESIKNNIVLAVILWLAGTTVIGMPVVLAIVLFRGMVLGYTISAVAISLGTLKGISFSMAYLLLQNLLFIPAVLTLGVSSIKLYKSIIKDRRKENIKVEIIKHTVICALMAILLIVSSFIENLVSLNILKNIIKYF